MGTPKLPPKDAFEKIRSRLQKREIYGEAITEAKPFMIKVGEDVHNLVPKVVDDKQVSFGIATELKVPPGTTDSIGFFHVGQDRYFFNGPLNNTLKEIVVPLDAEVFKLQRRKTLRAQIPLDYPITFLITMIDQKAAFLDAVVLDISGGGLCIMFPKGHDGKMTETAVLRGTIRAPGNKTIEFEGQVRHARAPDPAQPDQKFYGVELSSHGGLSQRMMALTMEVQRRNVMGY